MLTPVDIEMKEFRRAKIGGYHVDDVNDFLDEVIKSFEDMHRENIELKDKIILLNENISYYKSMEQTLQNTLVLAEQTAQDTKAVAYQKSEQIILEGKHESEQMIKKAEQEVYHIKQKIEELSKQYNMAKVQMKQMLKAQLEMLESQDLSIKQVEHSSKEKEEYYTREYKIISEEDAI